ncbi:MAG: hypothetical protein IKD68_12420, partial [Solobacterium sp.]|nr:hypothetical protein [Solobacterium sp.]
FSRDHRRSCGFHQSHHSAHVEDSVLSAAGGISPWLSAAILIIAAITAGAMYYRSKSAAGKPNDSGKQ